MRRAVPRRNGSGLVTSGPMRRALRKSIEHWYENLIAILAGEYDAVNMRSKTCMLCHQSGYNTLGMGLDCSRCPVARKVGRGHCLGTPWARARLLFDTVVYDGAVPADLVRAVTKEIHFLESLEEESRPSGRRGG